mgnify:FL=1
MIARDSDGKLPADKLLRLQETNVALLAALEGLVASNAWIGRVDNGDQARLAAAIAAIRAAKGESA